MVEDNRLLITIRAWAQRLVFPSTTRSIPTHTIRSRPILSCAVIWHLLGTVFPIANSGCRNSFFMPRFWHPKCLLFLAEKVGVGRRRSEERRVGKEGRSR